MLCVSLDDQRFIKEDLLGFPERYAMKLPVLFEISIVPIEPSTALERVLRHGWKYIPDIYADATLSGGLTAGGSAARAAKPTESAAAAG
jgi:hypothetical protein